MKNNGRTDVKARGKNGKSDGRVYGRANGRTDGRKEGRTVERTKKRKKNYIGRNNVEEERTAECGTRTEGRMLRTEGQKGEKA